MVSSAALIYSVRNSSENMDLKWSFRTNNNVDAEHWSKEYEGGGDIMQHGTTQVIFYVLYVLLSLLGIFGNGLVLYVILRYQVMQTVQNVFIANLSTSHILLCVFAPFTLMYTLMGEWIFGHVTCFFIACAQGVGFYASSLTLMCIAVVRYVELVYPFKRPPTLWVAAVIAVSIWVFSVLATVPYGISLNHMSDNAGRYFCEEVWPSELSLRIFGAFSILLQFVAPFAVIIYCYVKISFVHTRNILDRADLKGSSHSLDDQDGGCSSRERWETNRMLIIMAIIAGYTLLPLKTINLVADVYPNFFEWSHSYFCFFVAHALATSSLCCNPILYVRFSKTFRKAFLETLPCCHCWSQQPNTFESGSLPTNDAMDILLTETNLYATNPTSAHSKVELLGILH